MNTTRHTAGTAATLAIALCAAAAPLAQPETGPQADDRRPRVSLRAHPAIAVSPARVVLTAELVGGANDLEDYYCPTIEWDWGDDTRSEARSDCPPYEAGKSEIRRRFSVEHTFHRAGSFRVFLRLKRGDRIIAAATTTVHIRPGARDFNP